MGWGLAAALPRDGQARVGSGRALHAIGQHDDVPELLQAAGAADRVRELRRPQRHADSDPGPRHHGPGVVSGRHLGVRLDRSGASTGNRLFDRGPMDSTKLVGAGSWAAYWYNGYIVSSEISRGLDIFELQPSGFISQNEIDAAKLVHFDYLNAQDQPKLAWPASFVVARAYLDQLARSNGLAPEKLSAARSALARAEKLSGQERRDALTQLATQLNSDLRGAPQLVVDGQEQGRAADQSKVRTLIGAVTDLADAAR